VWFTVIAESEEEIRRIVDGLCASTDLHDVHILSATKKFKINTVMGGARSRNLDLSLRAVKLEPAASVACNSDLSLRAECNVAKQSPARILSLSDRARISIACTDIPHTLTPFKDWGVSTEELRDDLAQKRMRRFGAILRHQEAGFAYNAMVCFGLDERREACPEPAEGTRDEREGSGLAPHPVNGKFKVLFVGRHIERKGICYLIEAAKYLSADKFEIRIVGEGDLTEELKAQAAQLEGDKNAASIVFTGKLVAPELAREYREANVFVLPAIVDHKGDTEGLGVVLIEAMELGLPIVASDVGGIPDVVVNNESGILVPEKDPVALADAIKRIESDPQYTASLLEGARNRIAECFTWDKITRRQIEIYEQLANRKK
jgi:glycosyltransferase involved in cell wall biosynthesis